MNEKIRDSILGADKNQEIIAEVLLRKNFLKFSLEIKVDKS